MSQLTTRQPASAAAAASQSVPDDDDDGRPAGTESLGARRIGVPSLVFMIIAASAPLTTMGGGAPSNFGVTTLVGIPLSFVVLGVLLVLFAIGYAAMSRHVHNAGAFYAYIAKGLGKPAGVGASLVAVVALGFLVVIVYDVLAVGVAPDGITVDGLVPGQLFTAGVGAALAFSIAAFMGFESGAIYNEEVKDPRPTAGIATLIAICVIALFYAFSTWAMVMGEGTSNVVARSREFGPDLMFVFLADHAGEWFVRLANLMFITSLFAALVAFHNIVARYFFALGRERVLPGWLARTRPRSGAPMAGSLAQSGPGLVLLMALTSLAVLGFLRRLPGEYSIWTRAIAPGLAAIGLIVLFVLIVANFGVLIGTDGYGVLSWLLPAIVLVPGLFGTAWARWLRANRPRTYSGIGAGGELE